MADKNPFDELLETTKKFKTSLKIEEMLRDLERSLVLGIKSDDMRFETHVQLYLES
jgi:hypothetical protein